MHSKFSSYGKTSRSLSIQDHVCSVYVEQKWLALKMNQHDNQNHLSYLLECAAVCSYSLQGIY